MANQLYSRNAGGVFMERLIIIDNYDSFTYTIKNYFEYLNIQTDVIKNDDPRLNKLEELAPTRLVLSPGPGCPDEAGFTLQVIHKYHTMYPILGINGTTLSFGML